MKTIDVRIESSGEERLFVSFIQKALKDLFPEEQFTVREIPTFDLKAICQLVAENVQKQYPKVDYLVPVISQEMENQLKKVLDVRELSPQPEQGQGLFGIKCKCAKGHIWNRARATVFTQMPWCPECEDEMECGYVGRASYKRQPAVACWFEPPLYFSDYCLRCDHHKSCHSAENKGEVQ